MTKVRLVEENEAQGRIRDIYLDIKVTLKLPIVSPFFKALARFPDVLQVFWTQVKPNVTTQFYASAVRQIQRNADVMVESLFEMSDDYAWLKDHGYSREDMREIRYVLEMFYYALPQTCLFASALELAMQGRQFAPVQAHEVVAQQPDFSARVQTVRPDSAPREVRYIYLDILDTTKLPIVETIYQALAHWQDYLRHVWYDEVKAVVFTHDYEREAQNLGSRIADMAVQMPYPPQISAEDLKGEAAGQVPRIASFFQKVAPGTTITASGIRYMLIEGERAARAAGEQLKRAI